METAVRCSCPVFEEESKSQLFIVCDDTSYVWVQQGEEGNELECVQDLVYVTVKSWLQQGNELLSMLWVGFSILIWRVMTYREDLSVQMVYTT